MVARARSKDSEGFSFSRGDYGTPFWAYDH